MPLRSVFAAVLVVAAVACTRGSSSTDTSAPTSASPLPTTNVQATIVPGVWTYELRGLKASFTWKDGPPTLTVKNDTGDQVGAPAIYVVTQDQKRVDGSIDGSVPLADGAQGQYTVTFPSDLQRDDVGLVVLELGDENWGALAPKVIEG
jgi:hypothetical protein